MQIHCLHCRGSIEVDEIRPGDDVNCPVCGRSFRIEPETITDPGRTVPPIVPFPADAGNEGLTIPGYEILGVLGRGGMGVVYKARQIGLNRIVALKMILAGPHAGPEELVRFRSEAEAVAQLDHLNIVRVHQIGEHEGRPYFSLEFVDGGSLAQKLAGTPLHADEAARLVETLAFTMHSAHERGIVHRDLKPANVLLTRPACGDCPACGQAPQAGRQPARQGPATLSIGIPKIADFGLAKRTGAHAGQTLSGLIMGTPSYMAPEQAAGRNREVGPPADVWALGAILYECLTGRPPFKSDSLLGTLDQVQNHDPVPPHALQPKCPRDLETICLKCLQKDPRRRYPSAASLADDLRRFQDGEPIAARPTPPWERAIKWARRRPALAALAAVIAVAAVTILAVVLIANRELAHERDFARNQESIAETRRQQADDARLETAQALEEARRREVRLLALQGARQITQDPFGSLAWWAEALHLDAGPPEREALHRQRLISLARHSPRLVHLWAHPGEPYRVAFSPDGRRVLVAGQHGARLWDPVSGEPASNLLANAVGQALLAFSADTQFAAVGRFDDALQVWDLARGKPAGSPLRHKRQVEAAAFRPDGKRLATVENQTVHIWDLATGQEATPPLQNPGHVTRLVFSPDGRRLAIACEGEQFHPRVWDADSGRLVATLLGPQSWLRDPITALAFSSDGGQVVAAIKWDQAVWVWDAATGKPRGNEMGHEWVDDARFSHDGKRLLTIGGSHGVLIRDPVTGQVTGQRISPADDAVLSPDDRRIAAFSREGMAQVWDAVTGWAVSPPLPHGSSVLAAAFSPDGRFLVTAGRDRTTRLWDLAAADAPGPPLPYPNGMKAALCSSDGRRVMLRGPKDQSIEVWDVISRQRVGQPIHAGTRDRFLFSSTGQVLVTAGGIPNWESLVLVWDVDAGRPLLSPIPVREKRFDVSLSTDGARLAVCEDRAEVQVWDVSAGKQTATLVHPGRVQRVVFSDDGALLATATLDQGAWVWDAASGEKRVGPLNLGMPVRAVFSPDRRLLALGGGKTKDGVARVWDTTTGQEVGAVLRHGDELTAVRFSPDGRLLATASANGIVRLWDVVRGTPHTPPMDTRLHVPVKLVFSADSRRLLTLLPRTAAIWDTATGEPLAPSRHSDEELLGAVIRPDGQQVVLLRSDGRTQTWDLVIDDRPVDDLVRLGRVLSAHRVDAAGGLAPLDAATQAREWQDLRRQYPADRGAADGAALAWHEREADACQNARNWRGVLIHAEPLIAGDSGQLGHRWRRAMAHHELGEWEMAIAGYSDVVARGGTSPHLWASRARCQVQLSRWQEAAADYATATERGADWVDAWYERALVLLMQNDQDGYRSVCSDALRRFGQTTDPANSPVETCVLAPGGVADYGPLVQQAAKLAAARPKEWRCVHTLGAALYRAGEHEKAVQKLTEAMPLYGAKGPDTGSPFDWLYLAMAHQRLGKADDASRWLTRAVRWLDANGSGLAWSQRLALQVLRREAESLAKER